MDKVISCYIGTTFNDVNYGKFCFCEMPTSGEPTLIMSGNNAYFKDKDISDKIPYELKYELKTRLYQTLSKVREDPSNTDWGVFRMSNDYAWMRFDFIYKVNIPPVKIGEEPKVKVIKVTADKARAFLNELREKKKENLEELERKFIYYFGNI